VVEPLPQKEATEKQETTKRHQTPQSFLGNFKFIQSTKEFFSTFLPPNLQLTFRPKNNSELAYKILKAFLSSTMRAQSDFSKSSRK
jgi:hypothetical protein